VGKGGGRSGPRARLSERDRTKIEGRFGLVLLLLTATVFFSVPAPDGPWAQLVIALVLAANLGIAMRASGVRPKALRAWLGFAALGVGASAFVAATQEARTASGYLAIAPLLLTLATMGAIARRLRQHAEISVLTVLGAVCVYVLLGPSFALVYQAVGDLGSRPFFAGQEGGMRSDYTYFSFVTMATVARAA
jgi:hypothetical protein